MPTPTQAQVDEALETAINENGYTELMHLDAESLACDIATYCAELEECEVKDLVPLVQDWMKRNTVGS